MESPALWMPAVGGAYLIGSVPFGYLWVRLAKGVDIRTVGSGNIGATNAGRAMGSRKVAVGVFLLDVAKGFLPVWFAPGGSEGLRIACGVAAFLGHLFPVYLRFKGGKGVATGFGAVLGLAPLAAVLALATWGACALLTRYVSLSSLVAAASLPFLLFVRWGDGGFGVAAHPSPAVLVFMICCAAAVFVKHIPNIRRLVRGTEPKMGGRK